MAEAFVNVTEGSGKKLHAFDRTIGANTVLDEVVTLSDQYLASYVGDTTATSVATANDHLIALQAGASLNVIVRRIRVWQLGLATTAAIGQWSVFRLTTAGSGGTAVSMNELDATDAAAGCTCIQLPGVKGTEGTRLYNGTMGFIQTVPTSGVNPLLLDLDFDKNPRLKPIRIAAGTANGIALKQITAVAAATVLVNVEVTEQNF